jgi:hypothetical protein
MIRRRVLLIHLSATFALAISVSAQTTEAKQSDGVRVTVSMNTDGSRTVYEFDAINHKAVATTTGPDGKLRGRINYTLDDAGRFSTGEVHGRDGALRFKTIYKYDTFGRIQQETQTDKDDAVLHKLVYNYDDAGKQVGYSVFDASGRLISQTPSKQERPARAPEKKSRNAKPAGTR